MLKKLTPQVFHLLYRHVIGTPLGEIPLESYYTLLDGDLKQFKRTTSKPLIETHNEPKPFSFVPPSVRQKKIYEKGECSVGVFGYARSTEGIPLLLLRVLSDIRKEGPYIIFDAITTHYKMDHIHELESDLSSLNMVLDVTSDMQRMISLITDMATTTREIPLVDLIAALRQQQESKRRYM